MDAARKDGTMSCSEMGSAPKNSALRFFLGKYFSRLGGDLNSRHFATLGALNG